MNEDQDRKNRTSFEDMGRKLDDEVEKLIAYINDEVVPMVRQHSTKGLRVASDKLKELADYMESATQQKKD